MLVDVVVKVKYRVEAPSEGDALGQIERLERIDATDAAKRHLSVRTRQIVALDAVEVRP